MPLNPRFDVVTFVKAWGRNGRAGKAWGTIADMAWTPLRPHPPEAVLASTQQAVYAVIRTGGKEEREAGRINNGQEQSREHHTIFRGLLEHH